MFKRVTKLFGRGKTYTVTCPDGSTKTVHRDIDHAFPLYIAGWDGTLAAKVKATAGLDASVDARIARKIDGLLVALDEFNGNIMVDFRAAYIAFQSDPCGDGGFLMRSVERISDRKNQLVLMKMQIEALIQLASSQSNPELFSEIFSQIVTRLEPESAVPITVSKLRLAESEAGNMSEQTQ